MTKSPILWPIFFGVVVEDHHDVEAAGGEALIASQGVPHVACADQCHVPNAVHLQDGLQLVDQELDRITRCLLAELAELRDVLADLGSGDAHVVAQLLRGGGAHALFGHTLQRPQVDGRRLMIISGIFSAFIVPSPKMELSLLYHKYIFCTIPHKFGTSSSQTRGVSARFRVAVGRLVEPTVAVAGRAWVIPLADGADDLLARRGGLGRGAGENGLRRAAHLVPVGVEGGHLQRRLCPLSAVSKWRVSCAARVSKEAKAPWGNGWSADRSHPAPATST